MPDPSPAPLTPEELRDIIDLEKRATPGPWEHDDGFRIWRREMSEGSFDSAYIASVKHDPPRDGQGDCVRRVRDLRGDDWEEKGFNADLIAALRNAAPRILSELAALREENERLRRERADGGTKAMPPRSPPPPPPRPVRAVAGTSLVCTACGCRWKKHPPDDVFPNGSLQLYDADQRPCVECCDNTSNPPLRHETPNDAKGDPS